MKNKLLILFGFFCATVTHAASFTLSSPDLKPGKMMSSQYEFNSFGCSGENKSPVLEWSGAPAGTKSFAVTMYDPDAPTGSGWWHWLVINIPETTHHLGKDAGAEGNANLPQGATQQKGDFGKASWGGVCPPVGDKPHHYVFTVYALKVSKLDVSAEASAALTGYMIHANALGAATFTSLYARKK
jgi:Raf kinase inhibitor-like YbhB/YbcL family protein